VDESTSLGQAAASNAGYESDAICRIGFGTRDPWLYDIKHKMACR